MAKAEQFEQLREEMKDYLETLAKAADVILEQEVSSFPIFVVHQHALDIGINIVDREKVEGNWSVNASTLEEFVTKQIIAPEKVKDFKLVYKNPENELCLFVLNELGANFIFLPRKS
ncbi:MAG: hypothetical protein ACE5FF_03850 [Saprospiraceae bacterium]